MSGRRHDWRFPLRHLVLVSLGASAMVPRNAQAATGAPATPRSPVLTASTPAVMFAPTPALSRLPQAPSGPAPAPAAPAPNAAPGPTEAHAATPGPATAPVAAPPPGANPTPLSTNRPPPPGDAATALDRARAAYEYGDIDEMVESARQISDGRLHPTPVQRASALRLLGIGLFLTGRPEGAETAFFELLRLRPESRLDPQTTRPDAVAFFEQVRVRYAEPIRDAARASNRKTFLWNFFPPAGQFQNGHRGRGFTIAGVGLVSLATAVTTFSLLNSWEGPHQTFPGHEHQAPSLIVLNWSSLAVLGATLIYGVIDGIAHYPDRPDDGPNTNSARLMITPGGLSMVF